MVSSVRKTFGAPGGQVLFQIEDGWRYTRPARDDINDYTRFATGKVCSTR
jgi:hypothetical protein